MILKQRTQKLFAFWRYDSNIQRCLGAPVLEIDIKGRVSVKGYQGYLFTPIKLLPLKQGEKLWASLQVIDREYEAAQKALREKYKQLVNDLIPEAQP